MYFDVNPWKAFTCVKTGATHSKKENVKILRYLEIFGARTTPEISASVIFTEHFSKSKAVCQFSKTAPLQITAKFYFDLSQILYVKSGVVALALLHLNVQANKGVYLKRKQSNFQSVKKLSGSN